MSSLSLTIHRGTHQIGGVAAELCAGQEAASFPPAAGDERVVIDLGANLPGTDSPITDEELIGRVFDGRPCSAVLFTHLHGDHLGLFQKIPSGTRTFIGPTAKKIKKIIARYTDRDSLPLIQKMETYRRGHALSGFRNMRIVPFSVDHSAPDAYMFYIEAAEKRVLFTGDFRAHGVANERNQLWRVLEKYVPKGIDLLVTEGTLLSRTEEVRANPVRTEQELGERAREIFSEHKYNFVLVSSTNLDSVMEFYHAVPQDKLFICDIYQARIMMAAMKAAWKEYPQYRSGGKIFLPVRQDGDKKWVEILRKMGKPMDVEFEELELNDSAAAERMREQGFVILARQNRSSNPNVSEIMMEKFRDKAFITYSMWVGYLRGGKCEESDILRFIGETPFEVLHTSGHAFPEDIARLIQAVDPRIIVPMHTESAEDFSSIKLFAPWADRIHVLQDGEILEI